LQAHDSFPTPRTSDLSESVWPSDGPHDRDSVVTAAASAAALIRYLNNATQPARSQRTLPYASTISDVLGSVRSTVMHLHQLLGQLADAVDEHTAINGGVYDAERPDDLDAGAARAHELSMQLLQTRRSVAQWDSYRLVGGLAAELDKAAAIASGLGNWEAS